MGVNKTVVIKWLEDSGFTKWAVEMVTIQRISI